jgi:tetratricopeptide (TPR) repeat protein
VHNEKLESVRNGVRRLGAILSWRLAPILGLPVLVSALLLSPSGDSEAMTLQRADIALYSGDIELAEVKYIEVIEHWPLSYESGMAHARLAEIAVLADEKTSAIDHYLSAGRLSPESGEASSWMIEAGQILLSTGDRDGAREVWASAGAKYPESSAILNLASDLLASGDPTEAFEYFQTMAVSTGPYRELGHLGLSICYERMGELESAVAELDDEIWVERRGRLISRATASGR